MGTFLKRLDTTELPYCILINIQASCKVFNYSMRVRIFYHDHCFDWAASAAYFIQFLEGAQYTEAKPAGELGGPPMKLPRVMGGARGADIVQKVIRWMRGGPLEEMFAEPEIQELSQPLYERHLNSIELIRSRAHQEDGVLFFDLTGHEMEGYNKFIPYYLFPKSIYTVSVSPSSFRTKISVVSNPSVDGV